MASYKVLQDIEAEDKLVGPLTLRQFIYAGIFALCLYLGFIAITKNLTFFLVILLPVALVAAFFAFPWKLNQPTETWALAMIKFFVKPRKRVWDQGGIKEIVTITAPKTKSSNYTNNLSEGEVKSRLKSLANVLDTRGWAVKNSTSDLNFRSSNDTINDTISDRLVDINTISPTITAIDAEDSDDILDNASNPTSQRFSQLINSSSRTRLASIKEKMRLQGETSSLNIPQGQEPNKSVISPINKQDNEWFIKSSGDSRSSIPKILFHKPVVFDPQVVQRQVPNPTNLAKRTNPTPVTQASNPVILNFASNNDLSVATLARQINKQQANNLQNEVVVQLH